MSGTGLGVARAQTGAVLWRAGRADLGMSARLASNTAFFLRGGVAVPLYRPSFVLDGSDPIHRPGRIVGNLTSGLELDF